MYNITIQINVELVGAKFIKALLHTSNNEKRVSEAFVIRIDGQTNQQKKVEVDE